MTVTEHPFAQYLKILGRGPGRSRPLTRAEARAAFGAILRGEVEDVQLGALLLLKRYLGEQPDELAGFVEAARAHHGWADPSAAGAPAADLDWPSYAAGKSRGAPWFLLSALLLAQAGVRVLMHGFNSHGASGSGVEAAARRLGLPVAGDLAQAERHLAAAGAAGGFVYLPLERLSPELYRLIRLRDLLGLRTCVNSLLRLVNPLGAPAVIQGVFHPPYLPLQAEAAARLGQPRAAVFKGGAGEAERNPFKACTVHHLAEGVLGLHDWPALIGPGRGERMIRADLDHLEAVWRGAAVDAAAEATVVGTAALALALVRPGLSPDEAHQTAARLWRDRPAARDGRAPRAASRHVA